MPRRKESVYASCMGLLIFAFSGVVDCLRRRRVGEKNVSIKEKARLDLGTNFKEARVASGLSLRAINRITGLDRGWLSNFEKGRENISLDTMIRLADVLGKPLHVLLKPRN